MSSYQVIARKYRPQRFQDVVGQEHVTQTLANAIKSGRIAHAYLFCGPRGTGKTTIARIFAKALNCTGGPNAEFEESDPRCREIAEGRSLDVLEIDGASNNGVEQVRELRETARFAPASSKFKIYIIDEVHMLTTAAFNALLKTLEEPPAHVKFLFATTDPEKVLPTILSRCQRFDLRRIPSSLIVRHLESIAKAEGVTISEGALHAVARGADGGMRDAESTLDQLISFCGETIEEQDVLSMFGLAARAQILSLTRAILVSDAGTALQELDTLAKNGKDLGRLLNDLLVHFRNLMVHQVAKADLSLLEVSDTEAAALTEQSELAPADAVTRVLEVLSAAEGRLRDAVARKIFLEVTLMKAIQARNAVSLDAVLRQLQQLREEAPSGGGGTIGIPAVSREPARSGGAAIPSNAAAPPSSPNPTSAVVPPPPGSAPVAKPAVASGPVDPNVLWEQIVASASPLTRGSLQAGQPQSLEKGVLTVGYSTAEDSHRVLVDHERTRKALELKLAEMGCPATIRFVSLPGSAPVGGAPVEKAAPTVPKPAAPTPAAASPKSKPEKVVPVKLDPVAFKEDPLIREALELFKGQLVEVHRPEPTQDEGP
ncbi:MAG: DNA polymerase III subunit gamma/tau [Verrucomicrobiales bacterium]|nr:DNA polymerase III subunit gamma/tau [Verrucomicrobiales bacterium]